MQHFLVYQKGEGDEKISELNALLSQKRRDLLALRAENEDRKLEIEDYKKKIHQRFVSQRQRFISKYGELSVVASQALKI